MMMTAIAGIEIEKTVEQSNQISNLSSYSYLAYKIIILLGLSLVLFVPF